VFRCIFVAFERAFHVAYVASNKKPARGEASLREHYRYRKSFNERFRDECLNEEVFHNLASTWLPYTLAHFPIYPNQQLGFLMGSSRSASSELSGAWTAKEKAAYAPAPTGRLVERLWVRPLVPIGANVIQNDEDLEANHKA
jgi:hypothetical protein